MNSYQEIQYDVDEPVAVIRLNRPERLNALTPVMLAELRQAVAQAEADRRVVGIVITGNGRGFCAGLDAQVLEETTKTGVSASAKLDSAELPGLFTYLLAVRKPVIAAVNGVAAGGGLVLMAMSDIRMFARDARVTTVFLKRGLIAEHGMSWMLPRLLGPGRALDLLWTSDFVDGQRAVEIGLAEYLCEPDTLMADATAYVRKIAASASPWAAAVTKELVYRHLGSGWRDAVTEAKQYQDESLGRSDPGEGVRALLERREPRFPRLGDV